MQNSASALENNTSNRFTQKHWNSKKLMKRLPLTLSATIVISLLLMALFAPWLAPYAPAQIDMDNTLASFSTTHWLGTDHLGRDVLSRLIWASRTSLGTVTLIAVFLLLTGFVTGAISAYVGGWVDACIMRICEVFMTFQTFILAMFLVAILGKGLTNVIVAIVFTHWAWYSRMVRSMVLSLKHRDYITAAHVSGSSSLKVFFSHIALPVLVQLLILATLDIGHMMLHVSGLSFIGLGVQPPTAEWGIMINDARNFIFDAPHLIILPGLMIFLTVLAFNIPSDYLRDRLDPSLTKELETEG